MNQEQLLARRDELAREYHLGKLELYCTPLISESWAIYGRVIAGVALALLVLVIIIFHVQAQVAFAALVVVGFFSLIFLSDRTSVYVYSNGLVCFRGSEGRVVHWEEIRKVWISGGTKSGPALYAKLNDGTKISFPAISSQGSASNKDIQQFIEGNMTFAENLENLLDQ